MGWTVQVFVALLNIVWIIFFLTPEPFSVFVQRRSTNEEDQYSEFCIELPPVKIPSNKTNNTKTTSQGSPPEQEATTPGSPPEQEATTPGSPPEQEVTTPGSPEQEATTPGSPPELGPTTPGSPPELGPTSTDDTSAFELHLVRCCPGISTGEVPLETIKGYKKSDPMCRTEAIIIVTTKGRQICANPDDEWVKRLQRTSFEGDSPHRLTTPGSPPEQEVMTPGSPPEHRLTTPDSPPEQEVMTPGSPPEHRLTTPDSPPELRRTSTDNTSVFELHFHSCCFQFYPKRLRPKSIKGYRKSHPMCRTEGIIFVTTNGREICANPDAEWVKKLVRTFDEK